MELTMLHQVAERHRILSDAEWLDMLKRSITQPVIDGIRFPAFPPDAIQAQFVGSANEATLGEAYNFYSLFKDYSEALGMPLSTSGKMLDFGCGWGRFLRFFWRDFKSENLVGVDTDPDIIQLCRELGIQADLHHIAPSGRLPFPDATFTHIMAYSVFTHLPEHIQLHWLQELSRVARPGCVFICTTEPRRFLDFIASIPENAPSGWHAGLRNAAGDVNQLKARFDRGEFVFIPTGGGNHRDASIYGDAIIPETYIKETWGRFFEIRAYRDEPQRFWQAVVVTQKP